MKANVTASSQSQPVAVVRRNSHSRYQYKKVLDGRKQPIRGLWERNGKFFASDGASDRGRRKSSPPWHDRFDGQLAVERAVALPRAAQPALASIEHFLILCGGMIRFSISVTALCFIGFHVETLAQQLAQR